MKTSPTLLLLLAGLAGGVGLRLAFAVPAKTESSGARQNPGAGTDGNFAPAKTPAARPQESAILAAGACDRIKLLLTWLPAAKEEELRRMADELAKPDTGDSLACRLLLSRWAEVNPEGMLEWAHGLEHKPYYPGYWVNNAIEAWARVDFDRAWTHTGNPPDDSRTNALLGLAAVDPDKCLAFLSSHPELLNPRGLPVFDAVLLRLAPQNPAGTAALLAGITDHRREYFLRIVSEAWARSNPVAAAAWMLQLPPTDRYAAIHKAGPWIAEHAPEQLPALLETLPAGRLRSSLEAAAFAQCAASDPAAARRRLEEMPAGPNRHYCRAVLLRELVSQGDNAGAVAIASQIGWAMQDEWCPSYTEALSEAGLRHSGTRPAMVKISPEAGSIRQSMQELLGRLAVRDPRQAGAVLDSLDLRTASGLLSGEEAAQPAAVASLLLTREDENSQSLLHDLAGVWTFQDPAVAASWAAARSGDAANRMLEDVMLSWRNPGEALAWAATLNAERRLPVLLKVVPEWSQWRSVNAELEDAIRGSALPAAEKQQLLDARTTR